MSSLILVALAALAGAGVAVQALINARFSLLAGNAFTVIAVNCLIAALASLLLLPIARAPVSSFAKIGQAPWWMLIAGLFGVFLVTVSTLAVSRIGAGLLVATLVTSQLIMAVLLDHFGAFGLKQQPLDLWRILGVVMLLGGALLIQRG